MDFWCKAPMTYTFFDMGCSPYDDGALCESLVLCYLARR